MRRLNSGLAATDFVILVSIAAVHVALFVVFAVESRRHVGGNNAGAALKQLSSHESIWKQGDYDRNGQLDYWTRDVAGFHAVYDASGKALAVIDKSFAMADRAPGMAYLEVAGGPAPKQGYFYEAMTTDQNGNAYILATAPAPTAKNAPAGACTNPSLFGFVAYPDFYGVSGTLVFIVGEDGVIWQQDLGDSEPVRNRKTADPERPRTGWGQYGG